VLTHPAIPPIRRTPGRILSGAQNLIIGQDPGASPDPLVPNPSSRKGRGGLWRFAMGA
jgi:hypothetical protein